MTRCRCIRVRRGCSSSYPVVPQRVFIRSRGVDELASQFSRLTDEYFSNTPHPYVSDSLVEIASTCPGGLIHSEHVIRDLSGILKRLASEESFQPKLMELGMHKTLVLLLSADHGALLHAVLTALINLSSS